VVFQFLAARVGAVAIPQGGGPDAPGDPPEHAVFRVQSVAEKERQVRRKIVDLHAPRQISLDIGEAVGEGESQLGNGIRAGLGNVVAGDGNRVEILDLVGDKILGNIAH